MQAIDGPAKDDQDDYMHNSFRRDYEKMKQLKSTGKLRDSDEASEVFDRLAQSIRRYMEHKGKAQPKLNRTPAQPATRVDNRYDKPKK